MSVKEVVLEEVSEFDIKKETENISLEESILKDVYIDLKAVAGGISISVSELAKLSIGTVVTLEQPVEAPIQLVYGDHLIADGTLVVSDERLGVRITKVHYSNVVNQ